MNIRKIILVLCCAFSLNAMANDANQVLFDQVLPVKTNTSYQIELEDLQASDQVWTAVYLVGRQNYPDSSSKVDFVFENQGLLNKAKPTEHGISQTLVAENLAQSSNYSFNQFKELKKLLDKSGVNTITDPIVHEGDDIRVYSQVNDWIPEYNTYEAPMVKFAVKNSVDFDILAAYVLVGKGAKPASLKELDFSALTSVTPVSVETVAPQAGAESVTKQPVAVQPQTSVETSAGIKTSEQSEARLDMKFVIFILFVAVAAVFAFINRKKLKQAF